jgi:tetratricopeptide (TPR) repeat protein
MRSIRVFFVVLLAMVALVSCSRDPNVAKKRYLESGNKYFERGKYKEAVIMYRDALQKDMRYGAAYYRLALAQLKLGQVPQAVQALRRSVELNNPKDPASSDAHWDSLVRLSEIYLAVARENDKQFLDEVDQNIKDLLARDPNSWDGHRLLGDLSYVRAGRAYNTSRRDEGKAQLTTAIAEYRRAESIKPGQEGVEMQLARALAADGDYTGSEQLYKQVMDHNKTFQYAYTELYRLYMFERKPEEGEKVLKLAIQNNPKQYGFLTELAMHYSVLRRRDDMANVLQQIKSHAKDYEQAYLVVGDFYLRLGDGDAAFREYQEGAQKDAKKKSTYQKRMIEVLMRQGKRNEAAELNERILKETPDDNDAKGLQATFLLDRGKVSEALAELQGVVTHAPDNPVARYNLGRAHAAHGDWELARQMFQKAIELRPDYIQARLALAQLEVSRSDYDAALKSAAQILAIDRNNVNARLIESAALMGQKKYGDSRQLLESMLKVNPNSTDVLFQLGVVNLAENKYKEAGDAFRKSYELNPANPRGLMGMVETDMAQNKTDDALKLLKEESAKSPGRMDLVMQLANTSVRAGRYDEAIGYFQKVLDTRDKNDKYRGDILMRIGETYRRKGDLANAIVSLQKAKEILPENVVILSTLALVLDTAGKWTDAMQVYQVVLKMDPNNGVSLNNAAFLMAEHSGNLDSALTMASRAKQLMPNLPEVSDTLGWIYLKKNMADNAIETFRDLVNKQPHSATYRYHLGMALLQKGDRPAALKEFKTALSENPPKAERDKIQDSIQKIM